MPANHPKTKAVPEFGHSSNAPSYDYAFSHPQAPVHQQSLTGLAPSFVDPADSRFQPRIQVDALPAGSAIGDFEIEQILGRGCFGIVYLARQVSLNRRVALKVSEDQGIEGRTMAQLEHENIVQVFSESVLDDSGERLLCMQYVPGTTLDAVIQRLHAGESPSWSGATILQLIDQLNAEPPLFHAGAMRERQELGDADSIEAVCWIGRRLAEALAYAHAKGVLHRDIKPANILQTLYGQPLLADFSLAFQPIDITTGDSALFGGTLAYMAPEHLDAFHPGRQTTSEAVDERSDIYSLGVVLYELTVGDVALPLSTRGMNNIERLECIYESRKRLPPSIAAVDSTASRMFDRTVRRCMEPQPDDRFQNATELADELIGCKTLSEVESQLPEHGLITRSALRRPFFWLVLLALLPHMPVASTINIAYNSLRIVGHLSPEQTAVFRALLMSYNLVLYPICIVLLACILRPVYLTWKQLRSDHGTIDPVRVESARKAIIRWPMWVIVLACVGWFPGGIIFPVAIHWLAGPVETWVFVHFVISFALSGLIAMTYSYFAIQYLATRVFYPTLWCTGRDIRGTAKAELQGIGPYLSFFQMLAGLVPLVGALIVVGIGPEGSANYQAFRFLVTVLIFLGFCGFQLANRCSELINQTLHAWNSQPTDCW